MRQNSSNSVSCYFTGYGGVEVNMLRMAWSALGALFCNTVSNTYP